MVNNSELMKNNGANGNNGELMVNIGQLMEKRKEW